MRTVCFETYRSFRDLVPVLLVLPVGSFEFEYLKDASTSMDPGVEGVTRECLQLEAERNTCDWLMLLNTDL